MAQIVLGMWTSHGPTLSTDPDQWLLRIRADKQRKHPFRCNLYGFEELIELRKEENLKNKITLEERTRRHGACQSAITAMADKFMEISPDVAVIFGNDQRELFLEDIQPAMTIFGGEKTWDQPASEESAKRMPPGIHEAEAGHSPPEYREYPGLPQLANHILKSAMQENFDLAYSTELPKHPEHWSIGIPHAFGFVYRQIMRDKVIPNVPVISNTFFPPNQPTARRLFQLGRVVGQAINSWESDQRVVVFGSGGMSHFVIDEEFDQMFFEAFRNRDAEKLTSIPEEYFQSGTSELKNWVAAAGALFETNLSGDIVDYVPCYRSEAGTGTANGFVYWT